MTDKTFTFEKKEPSQVCSLRKFHNHEEYIYQHKRDRKGTDVITRCRECKIWLVVKFEIAPSSRFTGNEAWHMTCRVATPQDVELYTKMGKVRDV